MLTDRQQKFYNQISALATPTSSATDEERKYLSKFKKDIEMGKNFHSSIDSLDIALKSLDKLQENGLSLKTKQLFENLTKVYGEPVIKDIYGNTLIGTDTNSDLLEKPQGLAGLVELPAKLNGEAEKSHPSAFRWYLVQIFVYLIPMFVIPIIFPHFFSKTFTWTLLFIYLLIAIIVLVISGRKRDK